MENSWADFNHRRGEGIVTRPSPELKETDLLFPFSIVMFAAWEFKEMNRLHC